MRTLLVLGGAPGAGKTTWTNKHNLDYYTIRPDDIRKYFMGYVMDSSGNMHIGFSNSGVEYPAQVQKYLEDRERKTWDFVYKVLNDRMVRGDFIVVDATHTRKDYLQKYINIAKKHRYSIYFLKFETPVEEIIERNDPQKRGLKAVPEHIVRLKYEQLKNMVFSNKMKHEVKVVSKEEMEDYIYNTRFYPFNTERFKGLYVVGDIHGMYDILQKFIDEHYSPDKFYVFLGDLIDRGPNSYEVLTTLMALAKENRNILITEGNHDYGLWYWANDYDTFYSYQTRHTIKNEIIPRLEKEGKDISGFKAEIRDFYRRFVLPYVTFDYNGHKLLFTHAGIPTIKMGDKSIDLIPAHVTIFGVGSYDEIEDISYTFLKNHPDIIQFHGHRNTGLLPVRVTDNVFNLEGGVEFGGELRVVEFYGPDDFRVHTYKSDFVFKTEKLIKAESLKSVYESKETEYEKLVVLMKHPFIRVKSQKPPYKHIVSLNFSSKAFFKRVWDTLNTKARGLFVDTKNKKVVIRGFDKFFYEGETEFSTTEIIKNCPSPYYIFEKKNGFLLLVSYYPETNEVLYATKSTLGVYNVDKKEYTNPYVNIAIETMTEDQKKEIEDVVRNNPGYTFLFEVVNKEKDPHVVLDKDGVYFLAKVKNTILEYVVSTDNPFKTIPSPKLIAKVNSYEDMIEVFKDINREAYETKALEGAVVYDAEGRPIIKYKSDFYTMWKKARSYLTKLQKIGFVDPTKAGYEYIELINILKFMADHREKYMNKGINILHVMKDYYGLENTT